MLLGTERTGEFATEQSWSQNFKILPNGPVDSKTWRPELDPEIPSYNDEAQGYTNSTKNVRVEDGLLVIEARREHYSYPDDPKNRSFEFTSGRIDTLNSFNFEYGKIKIRMKIPDSKGGAWPAVWLLSTNQSNTRKLDPAGEDWDEERFYMKDGELDIVESYSNKPGIIEATVHSYKKSTERQISVADASETFHDYGIEVSPAKIVWTIDDKPYFTFKKPSDNPDEWPFGNGNRLYIILNLAMGGSGGGAIDPLTNKWRMEVESLNYYPYVGAK